MTIGKTHPSLETLHYQFHLDATVQRPNGSIVSVKQFSQSENPNSVGCFSYSSEYGDLLRVTEYGWKLNSEEVFIHEYQCTYMYIYVHLCTSMYIHVHPWTSMNIHVHTYIFYEFKAQDVHPADQDLCCPKKKNSNWLRFPGTSFGYTQYQNYHVVISCSGKLKTHWVHLTVDRLSKIRLPVIRWSLSLIFRFLILYITRVVYCTCSKSSTITLHSTFLINSRAVLNAWFACCYIGLLDLHSNKSFHSPY